MIKVSICMITYNHESFVEKAIDSILSQKTNFNFELIIGDDHSSDKTLAVINKFKKKYTNKIFLIKRKKNIGIMKNFDDILGRCKGEYIALCEGDDYWTNSKKLQKQVDFLDNNREFSICSHNVSIKDEISNRKYNWLGKDHQNVSTIREILKYGSGGATCSIIFRNNKKIIDDFHSLSGKVKGGDWLLQIICTKYGNLKYFAEVMGVYRRHNNGATFTKSLQEEIDIFDTGGVKTCEIIDKHLNHKYTSEIEFNLRKYFYPNLMNIYLRYGDSKNAKKYAKKIIYLSLKAKSHYLKDYLRSLYICLMPINLIHFVHLKISTLRHYNYVNNYAKKELETVKIEQKKDRIRLKKKFNKPLSHKVRVHFGCGPRILIDWINIDLKYEPFEKYLKYYTDKYYSQKVRGTRNDFFALDIVSEALPFPNNSVDVIFHEDFIEHLNQKEQIIFLSECYRILKPGGIHRVSTPSLFPSLKTANSNLKSGYIGVKTEIWDDYKHKNILSRNILEEMSKNIGYKKIKFLSRDKSKANIPLEYRPDPKDASNKDHIFCDLTK